MEPRLTYARFRPCGLLRAAARWRRCRGQPERLTLLVQRGRSELGLRVLVVDHVQGLRFPFNGLHKSLPVRRTPASTLIVSATSVAITGPHCVGHRRYHCARAIRRGSVHKLRGLAATSSDNAQTVVVKPLAY